MTTGQADSDQLSGLHVVVLPAWYPTPRNERQGVFFREQAGALQRAGATVAVAYPELRRLRSVIGSGGVLRQRFQVEARTEHGLPTTRWRGWNVPFHRLRPKLFRHGALRAIRAHMARHGRPDLVHVQGVLRSAAAGPAIQQRLGLPVMISAHESDFLNRSLGRAERSAVRKTIRAANKATAVSRALAEIVAEISDATVEVLPNFVNGDYFRMPPGPIQSRSYNILTVASLKPVKGVDLLVRAFAKAFPDEDRVRLVIAGDGPDREELETLARELGIGNRVQFLGSLSREEVRRVLWRANLFTLTSRAETFGIVLLEAMATGLPVVATACAGPSAVVTADDGYLVPPGNLPEIASALRRAWNNRESWSNRRTAIRCSALSRFGEKVVVPRIFRMYREVWAGWDGGD